MQPVLSNSNVTWESEWKFPSTKQIHSWTLWAILDSSSDISVVCGLSASPVLYPPPILLSLHPIPLKSLVDDFSLRLLGNGAGSRVVVNLLRPPAPCKKFAVELLTSRGQHKSFAMHMLREALAFPSSWGKLGPGVCLVGATVSACDSLCCWTQSYLQFMATWSKQVKAFFFFCLLFQLGMVTVAMGRYLGLLSNSLKNHRI